ncbi:MAG: UDP-N-acetylglucosamine 2-epimerase [Candidatus Gottesmanbacteria bacterium GW2011_GWA2_47_9]|uniref:UDP-N-acetylglucosamine 2-epimerase n=2 Tax=Microgenomates group TaxID=1794810 RepID=A0A0G0XTZ4_9BACT|nr:MAG: UDP-N-acetylglucosamine 2-epimerase [Candidatus Woesebacteria bacterium GW2011_GWA1_41_13b]KKU88566.1 MAG: UDP-N-acetylglucosamine 2-epimerase [Candidatus Gottesmanbacteria bacterium GW2011_GWA2_47_9]
MIYIILGTIGEFIKLFPVMKQLGRHGVGYRFVFTGQAAGTVNRNIKRLRIRKPDYVLSNRTKDLESISQLLAWIPKVFLAARRLPIRRNDYVIVHGDAVSTLLGFFIGKWYGAKIVHIESGKRTHSLFNPFPEEVIRIFISRFSDICFPANQNDANNIRYRGNVFQTKGNTIIDAVREVLHHKPSKTIRRLTRTPYVLFLVHRQENILLTNNLKTIVAILQIVLKEKFRIIWPLHTNTRYALVANNYLRFLHHLAKSYSFFTTSLFDYPDFIYLLSKCLFVVTDEGGVQEEAYILNKPTLVLRKTSENPGIGETAMLSDLDLERVRTFLRTYPTLVRRQEIRSSPSRMVVDVFRKKLL